MKIRRQAKAADELPPLERVQAIANIFSTFKNPDRETVLTPWRAVNMHLGECIGGSNFYKDGYEELITINENTSSRWIIKEGFTKYIFNIESKILEINSKSGLYPLYAAISIYQNARYKGLMKNASNLWQKVLEDNIYVVCRTKMAAAITKRTLKGFKGDDEYKTNIIVVENIVEQMSSQYKENYKMLKEFINNKRTWKKGVGEMKFNAVIGNPPYQSDAKQQIYTDFYLLARELGEVVSLIFPVGWQEPKNANNLSKLNNEEIKRDKQIVFIDNRQNVFPGISGAEWTNFILWKKGYDNELEGAQRVLTNGNEESEITFPINKEDIEKPVEIMEFGEIVRKSSQFTNMILQVSSLKPYGLRTDFLDDPSKYNLPKVMFEKKNPNDITIFGLFNRRQTKAYISMDYPIPKKTQSFNKFKVFIGKAWGNWSDNYLGGAYSDIIIAKPGEICTENFIEVGPLNNHEEAQNMSKYLMTRFTRGLLYLNKYSQDNSKEKFVNIPLQNFSESWWNETIEQIETRLFEKYKIPNHIRKFVLDNVQKKTEDNIINF